MDYVFWGIKCTNILENPWVSLCIGIKTNKQTKNLEGSFPPKWPVLFFFNKNIFPSPPQYYFKFRRNEFWNTSEGKMYMHNPKSILIIIHASEVVIITFSFDYCSRNPSFDTEKGGRVISFQSIPNNAGVLCGWHKSFQCAMIKIVQKHGI